MKREDMGIIGGGIAFAAILTAATIAAAGTLHPVSLPPDKPGEGVGRYAEAEIYRGGAVSAAQTAQTVEDWFRPEEADTVWDDSNARQSTACESQRTDIGCPDWNMDTTLWGWNGHHMEAWEMDLFSRIFYLEFWQPDLTLCEAGCDAILRLWESEYYSTTMYGTLSAVTESGDYAYSTYGYVWDWVYDPDGLAWCRAYCEERFASGPVWIAPFFRKGCYHDWAMPCYQVGNIFFSTGWGWM